LGKARRVGRRRRKFIGAPQSFFIGAPQKTVSRRDFHIYAYDYDCAHGFPYGFPIFFQTPFIVLGAAEKDWDRRGAERRQFVRTEPSNPSIYRPE